MLSTELTIVNRQIQMGKSTGEALRSFAERFDLEELRLLASVVTQSERFGASIANALRVQGDSLRTRRMQRAQEKAQVATLKILFPTAFCIFPSIFVVILGPAIFDLAELLRRMNGS
jgi:tight adherence protein C